MKGYPITFNVYANDEQEVETLRFVITEFIRIQAEQGRAVSATKLTDAIRSSLNNPIVRNRVNAYFNE